MGVLVDGVACDRSMDRRVCGQLSEIFRILPVRFQLVSPSNVGSSAALAHCFEHVLAHGCRNGDESRDTDQSLSTPGRGELERPRRLLI